MASGPTYEPIATQTLGAAAASITFSSIPATYTDLRLILVGKAVAAGVDLQYRYNGSSTIAYSGVYLDGSGSAASSTRPAQDAQLGLFNAGNFYTTQPSLFEINIFSYAGSTYKTSLAIASSDNNSTTGHITLSTGLWSNTAAITSISIGPFSSATNLAAGTVATLYGIKAA